MRITAELSLYPLDGNPIPAIVEFIRSLDENRDIDVVVNQMSTQLCGELDTVVACINAALARAFESGGSQVLVAKYLSADLPIADAPDLDRRG